MTDPEMLGPSFEDAFRDNFADTAKFADYHGARFVNETGEDVAQEAFARMWGRNDEMNYAYPRNWLYHVAKRIVVDNHRKARNRYEIPTDIDPDTCIHDGSISSVHDAMMAGYALDFMSETQREVVELTFLKGYSVEEAAEILEIPSGTAKSRRYYGLAAARAAFTEMGLTAADVIK